METEVFFGANCFTFSSVELHCSCFRLMNFQFDFAGSMFLWRIIDALKIPIPIHYSLSKLPLALLMLGREG